MYPLFYKVLMDLGCYKAAFSYYAFTFWQISLRKLGFVNYFKNYASFSNLIFLKTMCMPLSLLDSKIATRRMSSVIIIWGRSASDTPIKHRGSTIKSSISLFIIKKPKHL